MATVEVILREKVENLGAEADVVTVKRGFAANYLFPTGKAYEATKGNLRQIESLKAARAQREAEELEAASSLASRLKKQRLKLELITGQGGKAFGSITTMDIANALAEADKKFASIDRHQIQLKKPIKGTGDFEIPVKIHADVDAYVRVNVSAVTREGEVPEEENAADE